MDILQEAIKAVKEAGKEVLKVYGSSDFSVRDKGDNDPVTKADLASEKIVLESLKKFDYGILSEESADNPERLNKERVWIIDPLDGTKGFIEKSGEFSIMIGLAENGVPILGLVYQPVEDKLYFAQKGQGAFLESREGVRDLRVSETFNFKEVRPVVSRHHLSEEEARFIKKMRFRKMQKQGSIGLKIGLLAGGVADFCFYANPKTWEWDSCSPQVILEEAGGTMTDIRGEELTYNKKDPRNPNGLLATNSLLHKRVVEELNKFFG